MSSLPASKPIAHSSSPLTLIITTHNIIEPTIEINIICARKYRSFKAFRPPTKH